VETRGTIFNKSIQITISENKTKYMALNDPDYSNFTHNRSFLIDSYNFEVLAEPIYLGSLINCKNDLKDEIKRRIITENGMLKLMKSQLLKRETKCQLHKTIILPTVLHGSERWTLGKAHEALLGGFLIKILRRIYGAVQTDGIW
jgi:hypothetical protein